MVMLVVTGKMLDLVATQKPVVLWLMQQSSGACHCENPWDVCVVSVFVTVDLFLGLSSLFVCD